MASVVYRGIGLLLVMISLLSSCKKEVDIQIKEVDKTYSWTEVKQLRGPHKIILNLGKDARNLYLQTPMYLGQVSPGQSQYYISSLAYLPNDITVRALLTSSFVLHPISDSVLVLYPPSSPLGSSYTRIGIRLRQLDPQATSYKAIASASLSPIGAVNNANYVLLPYRRLNPTGNSSIRLLLTPVSAVVGQPVRIQPRLLDFPAGSLLPQSEITCIQGIDDYFLVSFINDGTFKVSQNGTVQQVIPSGRISGLYNAVSNFYKFRGRVYGHAASNLFYSDDDGVTWQNSSGMPYFLDGCRFYVVGDSLVGQVPSTSQLFTMQWRGRTARIREIKSDGLEGKQSTALERLNDTVYVSTVNGLFRRPFAAFFESQP